MRLVNEDIKNQAKVIVFSGNGRYPEIELMSNLCKKYNGKDKFVFYPRTYLKRQTGLSALNAVKELSRYFSNLIFLIDGEHVNMNNPLDDFFKYLKSIGISILNFEILLEKKTLLIKCKKGEKEFSLYCILLGEIFVEEQIAELIKIRYNENLLDNLKKIDKKMIKNKIRNFLRHKKITLGNMIERTNKKEIESIFQNICIVLKKIEKIY
ncbi:MAG: hypothetical protein ACTSQP_18145 [Promethearchaeota archaeon]